MSDTKITYKGDKEFWIAESYLQLALYYIYIELENAQYALLDKEGMLDEFNFHINGFSRGYMSVNFSEYMITDANEQVMVEVLQNVKLNLLNKGENISVSELMSIPTEDRILKYILDKKPFPTAELIRVIEALILMVQGVWESTNYNMDLNWRYGD